VESRFPCLMVAVMKPKRHIRRRRPEFEVGTVPIKQHISTFVEAALPSLYLLE
jgi:hypothetical protein